MGNIARLIDSKPGYRRPVLIIQDNMFNQSRISTVIVAVITSNLRLAQAPGNALLSCKNTDLLKDSVVNISQILTIDKGFLEERVRGLPLDLQEKVDE